MNMKKIFTYILAIAAFVAFAPEAPAQDEGKGIHLSKTITDFNYDTFTGTITMESFVEGEVKVTTTRTPMDIVLVLDVSYSMRSDMNTYSYSPRTSQDYSYDTYGYNTYYYKYGDEYYPVSSSREFLATIGIYTWYDNYRLYFTENGRTHYLSGTGLTDTPPGDYDESDQTIWTGVLYTRQTTSSQTRINALKSAAGAFVSKVANDAKANDVDHRIAIIPFASRVSDNTGIGLTSVKGADSTKVKSAVTALTTYNSNYNGLGWYTRPDLGMTKAGTILSSTDDTRGKIVIMFTDGNPNEDGGTTNFDENIANATIDPSYDLKNPASGKGATVYTIGVFDSETTNIRNYMNYVSSKYPKAESMTSNGGTTADGNYYFNVSEGGSLDDVFVNLADDISGGSSVDITEETVLKDVVSSYCEIPDGVDGSAIKTYFATFKEVKDGEYVFNERVLNANNAGLTINIDGNTLDVTGFDYSEYWCGIEEKLDGTKVPHGKKLIIELPFVLNVTPAMADMDDIPTNTNDSGLYQDGNKIGGSGSFDNPSIKFGSITITKEGLKAGESAIFVVNQTGNKIFDIVLTGVDGKTVSTVVPLLDPTKTYSVTEQTSWSWTYTPDGASSVNDIKFIDNAGNIDDTKLNATAAFKNVKQTNLPKNAEKTRLNQLKGTGSIKGNVTVTPYTEDGNNTIKLGK